MTFSFRLLDDEQLARILAATYRLLEYTGIKLTHPEARALLKNAGARLEGERAYIPEALILQALNCTPGEITIYDREGQSAMLLGCDNVYYGAHTDAPEVLDPLDHQRRPCLEIDVCAHARLIQALPNIHFLTVSGMVADQPAQLADQAALAQCLQNSTKPVLVMPISQRSLENLRHMSVIAVGGEDVFNAYPNLIVYAEPVSPLNHPDESISKLLYCAENNLPVVYSPFAACGGTAPMNPTAILVQLCAESLSGLVIHQLRQPGAPFIFGGMASVMDMKSTIFSYGAPEFQRGNTMMAEIAHFLGLPNFGTAGTSDAQIFDGQAMLEAATSLIMAHLCHADLVHDIGLLGSAMLLIPEMIVVSDHLVQMIQYLFAEIRVGAEDTPLEMFASGVNSGTYISDSNTLSNFRQVWYPNLFFRLGAKKQPSITEKSFEERVNLRTRQLIDQSCACELPKERSTGIRLIYEQALRSL
ncbi:MAG: trimethylamine methyltransferase family protein [Anaerolineales bacterium]|nr:trimethylamine methyltransferase family protein [Anaerolineales bacterium]